MIVGIGASAAQGVIDTPYCETTGQWATEKTLSPLFAATEEAPQVASPSSLLQTSQLAPDAVDAYAEVTIATAEGSELRCVSLERVVVETGKDGKPEAKKNNIVKNMLFDRDSFEKLLQLAEPTTA
jgi:hypothetical protein